MSVVSDGIILYSYHTFYSTLLNLVKAFNKCIYLFAEWRSCKQEVKVGEWFYSDDRVQQTDDRDGVTGETFYNF